MCIFAFGPSSSPNSPMLLIHSAFLFSWVLYFATKLFCHPAVGIIIIIIIIIISHSVLLSVSYNPSLDLYARLKERKNSNYM